MIIFGNAQINNTQITVVMVFNPCSPLQPSSVYLFGPKTVFVGEYTDTHYKMARFLCVCID
jgi:hypothetical protein